jgi:hypothetical protein
MQTLSETKTPKRFEIHADKRDAKPFTGEPIITAAVIAISRTELMPIESLGDRRVRASASTGAAFSDSPRAASLTADAALARINKVLRRSLRNLPRTKRAPSRKRQTGPESNRSLSASQGAPSLSFPRIKFNGFIHPTFP